MWPWGWILLNNIHKSTRTAKIFFSEAQHYKWNQISNSQSQLVIYLLMMIFIHFWVMWTCVNIESIKEIMDRLRINRTRQRQNNWISDSNDGLTFTMWRDSFCYITSDRQIILWLALTRVLNVTICFLIKTVLLKCKHDHIAHHKIAEQCLESWTFCARWVGTSKRIYLIDAQQILLKGGLCWMETQNF